MALIGTLRPPKQPAEKFTISVDFSGRLAPAETISTVSATSKNEVTGADTTGILLTGAAVFLGGVVSQKIQGGTDGDKHLVTFQANTTLSNILIDVVRVPVVA
jgi:hypothetical protein